MKVLKAVVIGTGNRAQAHLGVIPKLSDRYQLVAVCDIDPERAKTTASAWDVQGYTDLEEMLKKEQPDVGMIAVQAEIHHAFARVLAEHKVHILTETPIALTMPCADTMIRVAKENGVLMEVSENARRWPVERLKQKLVAEGVLGDVESFYLSYVSGSYHGVAAVRAIVGADVQGVVGAFPDKEIIRERGQIECSGGIKGTYEYNSERKNYWEVTGSKGAIRGKELHLFEGDQKLELLTETVGEEASRTISRAYVKTMPEVVWENPWQAYPLPDADQVAVAEAWCSLYEGVVHGKSVEYSGEDAKKDVELLVGIRDSAMRDGVRVPLPLTETTGHEEQIHAAFKKAYGADILQIEPRHMKQTYSLSGDLKELLYYGRVLGL